MAQTLKVLVGQHSSKGHKNVNQDFYGVSIPEEPLLTAKGVAIALADGIGSSDVSQVASEFAVMGFLDDYYCTSQAWSVRKSALQVLTATNSWLHSRTQQSQWRHDKDRGYVCTLSALVIKSSTAHVFHIGDTRIYRLTGSALEQLTTDHRVRVAEGQSYLSRAMGFNPQIDIDYQSLQVAKHDVFVLASDGVYEHLDAAFLAAAARAVHQSAQSGQQTQMALDQAARALVEEAFKRGSQDNLTAQIVVIDELPGNETRQLQEQLAGLALPPILEARMSLDGYTIVREVHGSSRSHIYLAVDEHTQARVILKTPSIDLQGDAAYLERFLMEEWIARRINNAHVLKPHPQTRERRFVYVATEFIDGQTLAQWMTDNPRPSLETVRGIIAQIARGLQAFHRLEMLHQDLRPANVMIDTTGTIKIIDFGSTSVAGLQEITADTGPGDILGTAQYTAPEYFLGQAGSPASDLFSLGIIAYQMLCGRLPYGTQVAAARTPSAQARLRYRTVLDDDREIPAWIDDVLARAVHPNPRKRYPALSEFVEGMRQPSLAFLRKARPSLAERNPVGFWKAIAAVLALALAVLLFARFGTR